MHITTGRAAAAALLLAAASVTCSNTARPPSQAVQGTDREVVARVGDRTVTLDEVDRKALLADAGSFAGMKLLHALYEARRRALDGLVADRLFEIEAETRGLTVEALLQREIAGKVTPVQDAEIEAWYRQNPGRVRGAPLDQVRDPIRKLLEEERQSAAVAALVEAIKKNVAVSIALDPPRQEVVVAANDPTLGPAGAPVQIVEYSDFQ
jgi:hypothetical protein